jgi:hypothetical protein
MTDPVTLTASEGVWWLAGMFAMGGVALCLLEAYFLIAAVLYDIRHRLTRRHDA